MSSLIHDLENNEGILLMYLADELPEQDRAEVEQMLATDASMRSALEELRGITGDFEESLHRLDATEPLSPKRSAAVREVGRAMAQWQVERLVKSATRTPAKAIRHPWWVYSVSAAAVVLIGLLAWWGFVGEPATSSPSKGAMAHRSGGRGDPFSGEFAPGFGDGAFASRWLMGGRFTRLGDGGTEDALDQVERELVALSDEPSDGLNIFGMPSYTDAAGSHE